MNILRVIDRKYVPVFLGMCIVAFLGYGIISHAYQKAVTHAAEPLSQFQETLSVAIAPQTVEHRQLLPASQQEEQSPIPIPRSSTQRLDKAMADLALHEQELVVRAIADLETNGPQIEWTLNVAVFSIAWGKKLQLKETDIHSLKVRTALWQSTLKRLNTLKGHPLIQQISFAPDGSIFVVFSTLPAERPQK